MRQCIKCGNEIIGAAQGISDYCMVCIAPVVAEHYFRLQAEAKEKQQRKRTAGPWRMVCVGEGTYYMHSEATHREQPFVSKLINVSYGDALLMQAAPELLKQLKWAFARLEEDYTPEAIENGDWPTLKEPFEIIRNAIKKAEGL